MVFVVLFIYFGGNNDSRIGRTCLLALNFKTAQNNINKTAIKLEIAFSFTKQRAHWVGAFYARCSVEPRLGLIQ